MPCNIQPLPINQLDQDKYVTELAFMYFSKIQQEKHCLINDKKTVLYVNIVSHFI